MVYKEVDQWHNTFGPFMSLKIPFKWSSSLAAVQSGETEPWSLKISSPACEFVDTRIPRGARFFSAPQNIRISSKSLPSNPSICFVAQFLKVDLHLYSSNFPIFSDVSIRNISLSLRNLKGKQMALKRVESLKKKTAPFAKVLTSTRCHFSAKHLDLNRVKRGSLPRRFSTTTSRWEKMWEKSWHLPIHPVKLTVWTWKWWFF